MAAQDVRKKRSPETTYMTFKRTFSQRATADGDAVTDTDIGIGPVTRWIAKSFDYSDIASNAAGNAFVVELPVPRGTFIMDCYLRLDQAFTSENADDVDIGDSNLVAGWADALNLSTSVGTTPVWYRDADAAYTNKASDISAATTGAQYYKDGGNVLVTFKTAFSSSPPTAGRAIVFLKTLSYNEPQNSEWT